jgi:hypothetical protein
MDVSEMTETARHHFCRAVEFHRARTLRKSNCDRLLMLCYFSNNIFGNLVTTALSYHVHVLPGVSSSGLKKYLCSPEFSCIVRF